MISNNKILILTPNAPSGELHPGRRMFSEGTRISSSLLDKLYKE
jgi:hypothetical protein